MKYITTVNEREYAIEIVDDGHVIVNGKLYAVDFLAVGGQPLYSLLVEARSYEAYVYPAEDEWQVLLEGRSYPVSVEDERDKRLRMTAGGDAAGKAEAQVKAPMPGLVVSIPVAEGQEVSKGQVLLILESMKMQNELKSPRDGVVGRVRVQPGDSVEQKQVLLTVEAGEEQKT